MKPHNENKKLLCVHCDFNFHPQEHSVKLPFFLSVTPRGEFPFKIMCSGRREIKLQKEISQINLGRK